MAGILAGSAKVAILPDFSGFQEEARAKLKSELSPLNPTVKVSADIDAASLAKVQAALGTLAGASLPLKFDVDPASVAKARAALGPLAAGQTIPLKFDVDAASVATARAALGPLAGQTVPVKFGVDQASLARAQASARDALGLMPGGTVDLSFDVNTGSLAKAMAQFRSATGLLAGGTLPLSVDLNMASLARAQAQFRAVTGLMAGDTVPLQFGVSPLTMAAAYAVNAAYDAEAASAKGAGDAAAELGMRQALGAVEATLSQQAQDRLTRSLIVQSAAGDANASAMRQASRANVAYDATATAAGGAGRRFGGWLGGSVSLFGSSTHAVGVWHIALDAAIETIIAVGTSAAALGATLYAFAPAAVDVYNHVNAVDSANDALDSSIRPLTKHFVALQQSMAPEALELYGSGLNLVNRSAGLLTPTIHSVARLMDGWTANIDIWAGSQQPTDDLLKSGVGFLGQFGTLLGDTGLAIVNLVSKEPGIVHFLLDVVEGGGKLLLWFSSLPRPIVETTLALHGIYLWGGLAVTALQRLAGGVGLTKLATTLGLLDTEAKTFAGLSAASWAGILALGAALAYIGYESTRATPEVQKFIGNINTQLAGLSASQAVLGGIASAIGQVNRELQGQTLASVLKGWNNIGPMGSQWAQSLGADARATVSQFGAAWSDMRAGLGTGGTWADLGHAVTGFGTAVKDVFVSGAGAPVVLKNNVSALNTEINTLFGTGRNLDTEIGSLMRGTVTWTLGTGALNDKLTTTDGALHSTTTGAYTFNQALALMDLAGVKSTDTLAVMRQKVANLILGYHDMGVQGGLLANAVSAVTFSLESQQTKAGNLTTAYTTFIDLVTSSESAFVTYAQGIGTLGAEAKTAGAHIDGLNTNSLTLRSTWNGSITDGVAFFNSLVLQSQAAGLGAKGYGLLTQSGKAMVATMLPLAKNSQAATSELYALAQVAGYQGPDSFKALAKWVGNMHNPMKTLDSDTSKLTIASSDLITDTKNLAAAISQNLNQAMSQAIFLASGGQKVYTNFAESVLKSHGNIHGMIPDAQKLAQALLTETGNVTDAHKEFDTFATTLDLTKQQADKLWGSLHNLSILHANPTVTVHASGTGVLTAAGALEKKQELIFKRAGGLIPGYGGGDSRPAMVEPGETIFPKELTPVVAPIAAAYKLPGFQAGGMVGSTLPNLGDLVPWSANTGSAWAKAAELAWAQAAMGQFKTSASAAASSFAAGPGGGAPLANANLARQLFPQWSTGAAWNAWNYVAMHESGWNNTARNPSSGAYGIPQALPASKMGAAANPPQSNPAAQIKWMASYMSSEYGGPIGAAAHEASAHWYDQGIDGAWLPPGLSLAANMTGAPEAVVRPDQLISLAQSGGGVTYNANFPDAWSAMALESQVRSGFTAMSVNESRQARIGRQQ